MPLNASPTDPPRVSPVRQWLPFIATLLVVALLRPAVEPSSPLVGKGAPDFTLATLDAQLFRLSDHRGQPVIVNFWASWCIPCREEAPLLTQLATSARNLTMMGMVFQDQPDAARAFVREFDVPFPSVIDPQSRVAINYGVSGIPETVFIDAQGVVREKHSGPFTREDLWAGARRIGVQGDAQR